MSAPTVAGMSLADIFLFARLTGANPGQIAQVLPERPVEGECFWLGGPCGKPTPEGDWLCPEHRAWTPTIATADTTAPRLKAVASR